MNLGASLKDTRKLENSCLDDRMKRKGMCYEEKKLSMLLAATDDLRTFRRLAVKKCDSETQIPTSTQAATEERRNEPTAGESTPEPE
jgi:hypothetical protein